VIALSVMDTCDKGYLQTVSLESYFSHLLLIANFLWVKSSYFNRTLCDRKLLGMNVTYVHHFTLDNTQWIIFATQYQQSFVNVTATFEYGQNDCIFYSSIIS